MGNIGGGMDGLVNCMLTLRIIERVFPDSDNQQQQQAPVQQVQPVQAQVDTTKELVQTMIDLNRDLIKSVNDLTVSIKKQDSKLHYLENRIAKLESE